MDKLNGIPEPDPLRLIDYVEGRLSADEAKRVEALVAASGLWRAELALARSFAETAGEPVPAAVKGRARRAVLSRAAVPLPSRTRPWLTAILAAASLALVFLGGRELLRDRLDGHPRRTVRSVNISATIPLTVERDLDSWVFQWSPPAGAGQWRVLVTDVTGRVLLETPVDPTWLRLGLDALADSGSGPWLVQLVATGVDGVEIRSALVELP